MVSGGCFMGEGIPIDPCEDERDVTTHKFLGMVKAKARKEQPSTDPFLRLYSIHYVVVFVLLALYIYIMYSLFI
jgi:hypothetical protein